MIHKKEKFCISCLIIFTLLAVSCRFNFNDKDADRGLTIIGIPDDIGRLEISANKIGKSFGLGNAGYGLSSYLNALELSNNGKKNIPLYDNQTKGTFRGNGTYQIAVVITEPCVESGEKWYTQTHKIWLSVQFINGNATVVWDEGDSYEDMKSITEYNPEKAGAEIIAITDISELIPLEKAGDISLASDEDFYYLFSGDTIHFIDKNSMKQTREIKVIIPEAQSFSPQPNQLAVFEDKVLFGAKVDFGEEYDLTHLFLMDIDGSNVREIHMIVDDGHYNLFPNKLGDNQNNDMLWLYFDVRGMINYTYNTESDSFTQIEDIDFPGFIRDSESYISADGDDVRHGYAYYFDFWPQIYLSNYNTKTSSGIYYRIQVPHLGLDLNPFHDVVYYDFPFVIIITIDKDRKIQLLKLLPNE